MVATLKFVYIVILFVSLFLVVALGQRECDTDEKCYKKYPSTVPVTMICFEGYCRSQTIIMFVTLISLL
ncbi:unnamed protein product [Trifolium pratense]|uniref:Uncharacterized protein n=1 Tax=Trifolium pratense TaxID=57577 RepID=A0ACB0LP07_TRIPR|nr:unnamed protein product [Trifolium pratense]